MDTLALALVLTTPLFQPLACKGAASGVRVNSIVPGIVETPLAGEVPHDILAGMTGMTQLIARPIQPEEVRWDTQVYYATLLMCSVFRVVLTS